MPSDLTKTSSHIIWLWAAILALTGLFGRGYLALRSSDECLADKIAANELRLQVQLTEIKTQLSQMNITLFELKKDVKMRNEP